MDLHDVYNVLKDILVTLGGSLGDGSGAGGGTAEVPGVDSTYNLPSNAAAANQDSLVVKASAGSLYNVMGMNNATALRYLKIYDKATGPTSADTPRRTLPLPAGCAFAFDFPKGMAFATGISFRITTGAANNDANAAIAADITGLSMDYD